MSLSFSVTCHLGSSLETESLTDLESGGNGQAAVVLLSLLPTALRLQAHLHPEPAF